MAANRPKSLKKRIDTLIDALGGAKKPTNAEIRNQLVDFAVLAEALEDGQATAEKEATIAALEKENKNLQIKLQMAHAELETFRAERKKQEEEKKRGEIPPIQFQILDWLPSEHSGKWRGIVEIAHAVSIPVDVAEIHLSKLKKAGLAIGRFNTFDAVVWHRSETGNELVHAKRLAGEEENHQKYKHAELPQIQHDTLLQVAKVNGALETDIGPEINQNLAQVQYALRLLKEAQMVMVKYEDAGEGYTDVWYLFGNGQEYLAERDLL